ncbi:MAG: hypothetical protein ACI9N1_000651 [Flavobacteriales bacterium]
MQNVYQNLEKMKKLLTALALALYLLAPGKVTAQEYEDLLVLYVDEKYEKCYDKSIKYTLNDKTKNDALPYLFCSMALYEMSRDHKYIEMFPKAFKDCLGYAAKYRKKDEELAYRSESIEHIETLKKVILEEADNYILEGEEKYYKKALSTVKKVVKIDPDDRGSELLRGELEILTKNKSEGRKMVKEAMTKIDLIGEDVQFSDMTLTQQMYLKYSLIFSAKLANAKDPELAKSIIAKGQAYFGEPREDCLIDDNSDFIKAYKLITG